VVNKIKLPKLLFPLLRMVYEWCRELVIEFNQNLTQKDFIFKKEWFFSNRLGKRQVLSKDKTKEFTVRIYGLWERKIVIPRIRHGKKANS